MPHRHGPGRSSWHVAASHKGSNTLSQRRLRQGAQGLPRVETRPPPHQRGLRVQQTRSSRDLGNQQGEEERLLPRTGTFQTKDSQSRGARQGGARRREGQGQDRGIGAKGAGREKVGEAGAKDGAGVRESSEAVGQGGGRKSSEEEQR